ncbi:putative carbohydrate esterase family 15 protein [Cladorrhinum samala]|uniref:(4-O-methyl)-D-glucuronate--lignin esterase n=1 Tax=Cladorrhinum samala TaxID=585594 RepID=A0AAV9I4M6_9PEZI|nr:putative carbohydrate esterase family 15 protein [Cladorrhinum samala]
MLRLGAASVLLAGLAAGQSCGTLPVTTSFSGNAIKLPDPFTFLNGSKRYELGPMPAAPEVQASLSGTRLTITVKANGKTLTMTPTIRMPSSGQGPFPALIALGGVSIPVPANVALITYNNEEITATNPRGKGKFFDFRIMDTLEQLGPAITKIDPKRIAITGCLRNGKGAIFATEFSKYINALDKLPHNHHILATIIAPRPFLVIKNSGIDYLSPISSYGYTSAARMVYEALSATDAIGFSQVAYGSSHYQLPSSQNADVAAFFNRFLLGQDSVSTKTWKPDAKLNLDLKRYVDWTAPKLG